MNNKTLKLAQSAIFAALAFISFTYLQVKIPVPGGGDFTSIHFGNVFLVVASLLLGGLYGGLSGAVGMTIGDLVDPVYMVVAPKTFILKLCIGLIIGFVAHKLKKIDLSNDKKYIFRWAIIASICGMAFNVVADPLVGYFYKLYILGQPQDIATALAKLSAGITFFNAIITVIVANIIYNLVRPVLKNTRML